MNKALRARFILVGNASTGKTSVIHQYTLKKFD